jgi:hypothetical protein
MTKGYLMNNLIEKVRSYPTIIHAMMLTLEWPSTDAVARPGLSVRREPRVLATLSDRTAFCGRFMGLNDLMTEIKLDPTSFQGDETVENKVLNQVLALVEDKISEVKNQAVKWSVQRRVYLALS